MLCVVDYGVGNLYSLCSSLAAVGADAVARVAAVKERVEVHVRRQADLPDIQIVRAVLQTCQILGIR